MGINQEFEARFREIDEEYQAQVEDTFYDIGYWLGENFAAEEAQYVTLAAKVDTKGSRDVRMYAAAGIAALAVVCAVLYTKTQKKDEKTPKHDQVVETLFAK